MGGSSMKVLDKVDRHFSNYKIMSYIDDVFHDCFGESIILKDCDYGRDSMGFFRLEYDYSPKGFNIEFEHERSFFSIWLKNKEGKAVPFAKINEETRKYPSGLSEDNIAAAIRTLYKLIQQDSIKF